ncbi:MAG: hypothetical protein NWE88_12605 [Candidatus Bathyarchaeota archaeon]|nr:hypothetical protein [Candidatus Bathyarchaeota archaeon]
MKLHVPANKWYGGEDFEFPESWDVQKRRMAGHDAKALDGGKIVERFASRARISGRHISLKNS